LQGVLLSLHPLLLLSAHCLHLPLHLLLLLLPLLCLLLLLLVLLVFH
jgi:hypothetical protein